MSEDESIVFFISYVLGVVLWTHWHWTAYIGVRSCYAGRARRKLLLAPLGSATILYAVLKLFSSFDVRNDFAYLWAYFFMGAAWTGFGIYAFSIFGVSARDHVIERKNEAASYLLSGAVIGLTLCFAGGNIGDGPGWWVVIFAAALSTGTFFLLWCFLGRIGENMESVTLDRDRASGLRGGAFLLATGLILGRAVAGNWVSADATIRDFVKLGWPAFVLLLIALSIEHKVRPGWNKPARQLVPHGVLPGILYITIAVLVVLWHGSWK
jgi:hypothetical protein